MSDIPLGKQTPSPSRYDPSILFPIARPEPALPMFGFDLWRSYELAWLTARGKPCIGILELIYPRQSRNIVESKSLKLYLHGLSNRRFGSLGELSRLLMADLERILETPWLSVVVYDETAMASIPWHTSPEGTCIDSLDIEIHSALPDPMLLATGTHQAREVLYSHVLRTFCPITHQPDWGSVIIDYAGRKIRDEALLSYICSYRDHEGFGEQCCEQIYRHIMERCRPQRLTVSCLFTRRGGIDINPVRANVEITPEETRPCRLIRQ